MTDDITRRNFVALAGAGTGAGLLSACQGEEKKETKSLICTNFGADPHGPPSFITTPNPAPTYQPDFMLIMHVDFTNKWEIAVNHAHFTLSGHENDRLNRAKEILRNRGKNKFRSLTGNNKPYNYGTFPLDYDDIQKNQFRFGSQHEIYIYIDNETIITEDGKILTFSEKTWDGDTAKPNYSFFNTKKVDSSGINGAGKNGQLVKIENWMTDENGANIANSAEFRYSMNIHFLMQAASSTAAKKLYVPLVIDPDTGNGFGHKP